MVNTKGKKQGNPDAKTSTFKVQRDKIKSKKLPEAAKHFRTHPDLSWDPPSIIQNRYRVSSPRVMRPRRGVNNPKPYSDEVKEKVEL
jgi:hypothetical protein